MVVYSRWCGELISDIQHCGAKRGLSPLARGTHERGTPGRLIVRFIPAGAGNSRTRHTRASHRPVYPRWRGELGTCLIICVATVGLSPLARGTLPLVSCRPRKNRFIPAGAGNSNSYTDKSSKQTVYPRWRGELAVPLHQRVQNPGLSPLARGTRCCLYRTLRESRFIPAGAGNSYPYWNT